jgi:hypothetical protein
MYEQALAGYAENSYYRNECARTKYMLGTVQRSHGNAEAGEANVVEAQQLALQIRPDADVTAWVEIDYDLLVMPWSR